MKKKGIAWRAASLLIGLMMFVCCGCTANEPIDTTAKVDESVFSIETPYCTLYYPTQWEDTVTIHVSEDEPCKAAFSVDTYPLFDILFNSNEGEYLGTLTDTSTTLCAVFYEWNEACATFEEYTAMQEDINVILEHLMADYPFTTSVVADDEVFAIETEVATFYYPTRWEKTLTVDVAQDRVSFSTPTTLLFELRFNGDDGHLLGTYDGTEIRVVYSELESDGVSEETYREWIAMQEDVNVILEYLSADSKFIVNMG